MLNFAAPHASRKSAALFETVGRIDPELFATDSSGYTQYGRAYLSLQSFVEDSSSSRVTSRRPRSMASNTRRSSGAFRPSSREAPRSPATTGSQPARPGIPFPDPAENHQVLRRLRTAIRVTREALRKLTNEDDGRSREGARHKMSHSAARNERADDVCLPRPGFRRRDPCARLATKIGRTWRRRRKQPDERKPRRNLSA